MKDIRVVKMAQRESDSSGSSSNDENDGEPTTAAGLADATAATPLLGLRDQPRERDPYYRMNVLILLYGYIFMVMLSNSLLAAPQSAIMENIICRKYFSDISSNIMDADPRCKSPDVQGPLAMIRGWNATFDCLPGLLGSIPFGIMSDKLGRRPVLLLASLGFTLSATWGCLVLYFSNVFALQWYWLGSAFMLLGGGPAVLSAMIFTMAADMTPAAGRATVFFRLGSATLVAEIFAGPLTGLLMRKSEWLSVSVSISLMLLGLVITFVIPETLGANTHDKAGSAAMDNDGGAIASNGTPEDTGDKKMSATIREALGKAQADLAEVQRFVLGNLRVSYLLLSIVFVILGKFVQDLLLQYATKRYGWSWDQASVLLSIRSASTLVLLMVVLPGASWVCTNILHLSGLAKDLWLARVSGVIQIAGGLLVASAVTGPMLCVALVVFAGGGGLPYVVRSLASALVEEHHIGIVNTLIGLLETAGLMVAGPLLSKSLRVGFELGGPWVGLPFLCASVLFAISTAIVWTFRIPRRHRETAALA